MFRHDAEWQRLMRESDDEHVRAMARVAFERPVLRSLFPFASHSSLHFSRTDKYPWDDPFPYILMTPFGKHQARGEDNQILGAGDLHAVVTIVERFIEGHK